MIRHINEKLFKNKKFKLFAATVALAIGLTSCGITNSEKKSAKTELPEYEVEIQYSNWDKSIQNEETITFSTPEGAIYHGVGIEDDGVTNTTIYYTDSEIISNVLQQAAEVPNATEDDKIILKIDYKEKTMDTEVVPKDKINESSQQVKTR